MKLELALALASLLPAAGDQAPSVPQPAPAVEVCPDALQRSQCRRRCSPAKMILHQPCADAGAEDAASCRDEAIERCLRECLADQCRTAGSRQPASG